MKYMKQDNIFNIRPLGFMWHVANPFIFCAHHRDIYPPGNADLSPQASLEGRNIGQDFQLKDGWRMYHGKTIPGFPEHPHRGFETITIVLEGFVDHSDSWGQAGRYGMGDVQWMTAGEGLQHSEMFPLLNTDKENPAELFQLWLNLPKERKLTKPYFKMLWNEEIPVYKTTDKNGNSSEVKVIAGEINNVRAPVPAPDSWAAFPENNVAVWLIKLDPYAEFTVPASPDKAVKHMYYYRGNALEIEGVKLASGNSFEIRPNTEITLNNGDAQSYLLLLQGNPIHEPIVQYGPFVMNSQAEIRQAFDDYNHTQFGGWPWHRPDMIHPREEKRFAKYADGRIERPNDEM